MAHRIAFEVSGYRYETLQSTLCRYPNTLLGNAETLQKYYDWKRGVYCFDRNKDAFDAILFFYQSQGILAKPSFVSESQFLTELEFFGIINKKQVPKTPLLPTVPWRRFLWKLLEDPKDSMPGILLANFSFLMIVASVTLFCVETVFVDVRAESEEMRRTTIWFYFESFFIAWFTLEYTIRVISCPNRLVFLKSLVGIIDILSILPYYVTWILTLFDEVGAGIRLFTVIRMLRLLQIIRAIKLTRHSSGLQVLLKSLTASKDQLSSLVIFFVIAVTLVSSVMYLIEVGENEKQFESIPYTMWFAIISMSTVGYGDVYPKTILGKVAATCGIFLGAIILFHLFIPIYLTYFTIFYRKREREKKVRDKYENKKKSVASAANKETETKASEEGTGDYPRILTLALNKPCLSPQPRQRKVEINVEMKTMHVLSKGSECSKSHSDFRQTVLPFLSVPPKVEMGSMMSLRKESKDYDWMIYEWEVARSKDDDSIITESTEPSIINRKRTSLP